MSVIGIVLGFKSSDALGAAYGLAVTGTMTLTSILAAASFRLHKKWRWIQVMGFAVVFVPIDLIFFISNSTKIPEGGWLPLALAGFFILIMGTWKKGHELLRERVSKNSLSMVDFIKTMEIERQRG